MCVFLCVFMAYAARVPNVDMRLCMCACVCVGGCACVSVCNGI